MHQSTVVYLTSGEQLLGTSLAANLEGGMVALALWVRTVSTVF